MNNKPFFLNRSLHEWLFSLPIFCLLLLTLIIGTGEMIHGQLLRGGEKLFGDPNTGVQYFMLRADPTKPDCNPDPDVDAEVQKQLAERANPENAIDSLFADEPVDPDAIRQSVVTASHLCQDKMKGYVAISKQITPAVKAYRTFETAFFTIFRFGTENRSVILILMVVIAATLTTMGAHHISLRPPTTKVDFKVYSVAMVVANLLLLASTIAYWKLQVDSGIPIDHPIVNYLWTGFFAILTLISFKQLIKPPANAVEGGSFGMALLSIPLYAFMALNAGLTFLSQKHYSGLAIYLGQMVELSGVFLNLSLYLWAGMLLKQTRVVDLFLNIVRPWGFSPEVLTYIILVAAAVPTAYTGASGIFVIAAGAVIYREILNSGARRQYALAATAMSGSLGVVLSPCLLVVVIAALNKQVTTSQLYGWGAYVFLLSSTLFLVASLILAKEKFKLTRPSIALPQSARAFVPVSPYIVITILVVGTYAYILNTKLDEFTAPMILPFIMLAVVWFDKVRREPVAVVSPENGERRHGFEAAVREATNDTIGHIGALIMLMALSVSIGGVIERSGVMDAVPASFGNIWLAVSLLLGLLVFIGMVMDPFGAVILVSATIAPIAYNNGIQPVHFWMIVLTAFELGYLSPPVALNQLLTRQVVGEPEMDAADAEVSHLSFYYKYERWILPCIVMATALLLVAFVPLFFYAK
ncbi:TRAP-type C4-dicarboxylate transport system permease large subunit [Fluviicoccus keumensis]|uniref:TRAP-type C4-dicarboxylate transport system permease large subunit n=1 Tax=Fluviicoccus keumensis TaxID=1435465 RepID=A0A4Q7YMT1_9GAMM|nr:TRAP transporter large permease subunit [Fluviicoccus keumensis]RZU38274.1 TRAP-type C4-dicarboxylate transport system permease large subunit [Fluviicoccus keumensis]